MPRKVALHQLESLSNDETKNEILLDTSLNVELHIISQQHCTIIRLPYGNRFDIIDGQIIIHEK